MIDVDIRPCRSETVLSREVGETVLLLDTRSGEYFSLEGVGARIWALCDGKRSSSEIGRAISAEYDEPLEVVSGDVLELLENLERQELIVVERPGG